MKKKKQTKSKQQFCQTNFKLAKKYKFNTSKSHEHLILKGMEMKVEKDIKLLIKVKKLKKKTKSHLVLLSNWEMITVLIL